jgi:hypothetical protein
MDFARIVTKNGIFANLQLQQTKTLAGNLYVVIKRKIKMLCWFIAKLNTFIDMAIAGNKCGKT